MEELELSYADIDALIDSSNITEAWYREHGIDTTTRNKIQEIGLKLVNLRYRMSRQLGDEEVAGYTLQGTPVSIDTVTD